MRLVARGWGGFFAEGLAAFPYDEAMTASARAPDAGRDVAGAAEFTPRAVLAGVGVGAVLAIGNVYMGLKTGWWDSGSITAAVIGFGLLAPGGRRSGKPYSPLENNITQTVAGSAAVMPATLGLLGGLPALELLGHRYPAWAIGSWGFALAIFGILLAVPMRQRFVVSEPLPFPSAIATAEVIRAVHASSDEARARMRALFAGAAIAIVVTWLRDGKPAIVPGTIWIPVEIAGASAESLTLGVAVSPMLVSVGMLVGVRSGFSLLAGSILAWGLVAPALVRAGIARAEYSSLVSWLLWPGVAMMVSSGLVGLATRWRSFAKALSDVSELRAGSRERGGWVALFVVAALVVLSSWLVFGVHPAVGAIVVLVSVALVDVCVRTAGETDIAPLGLIVPGAAPINVAGASVAAGAGAQSAVTVNALKAGHVLGAPPRGQLRAQMLGAAAGLFVALAAYTFVRNAHGIGNAILPAPSALSWKALAELAEKGTASMPEWAGTGCALGAGAGMFLSLLEQTRVARFVPSPIALAAAFLVPASTGAAIGLGTLVWIALRKRNPDAAERLVSSVAAGGIAGESVMGFVVAALMASGMLSG
jgi:uncharacterized oligopeptide transporter (OPT) family protein